MSPVKILWRGKHRIKGTRVRVIDVIESYQELGWDIEEIATEYEIEPQEVDDFRELIERRNRVGVLLFTKRIQKKKIAAEITKIFNHLTADQIRGEIIHLPWEK